MHQNQLMDDLIRLFERHLKEIDKEEEDLIGYITKYSNDLSNKSCKKKVQDFKKKSRRFSISVQKSFILIEKHFPDLEEGEHAKHLFALLVQADLIFNQSFVGFIKPFRNINELKTFLEKKYEDGLKKKVPVEAEVEAEYQFAWYWLKYQLIWKARIYAKKKLLEQILEKLQTYVSYSYFVQLGEEEKEEFHQYLDDVKNYGEKKIEENRYYRLVDLNLEEDKDFNGNDFNGNGFNVNGFNSVKYGFKVNGFNSFKHGLNGNGGFFDDLDFERFLLERMFKQSLPATDSDKTKSEQQKKDSDKTKSEQQEKDSDKTKSEQQEKDSDKTKSEQQEKDSDETKPEQQDIDSESMLEDSESSESIDETKPEQQDIDSESMLEDSESSESIDETKPEEQDKDSDETKPEQQDIDSESMLEDSESSESIDETKPEEQDKDSDETKPEQQDIDSESMLEDSEDSESILEDSESILEDSESSESILEDSESILKDSESILEDSESILKDSESMLEDSESSESILEDSESSESILEDSESILEDSESSESILEDSESILKDSESILEDSEDSESILEDSEDSESILEDSEDSESILEDSESILEDSESSESIDETKPEDDTDRWNSERFKHLWFLCENCDTLIYKKLFLEQKGVCSECGATLQLTSSERIQLLIDHGTWRPMNMTLSSMDVLDKKHTTFDIKMVQKYSIVIYEGIYDFFFHNQFLKKKNALKILARYNSTLVDIVNVVLEKKFIKYLNLDSKKIINIIQDIIDTGLRTVQFVLFEIGKKMRIFFYWVQIKKYLLNFQLILKFNKKLANLKEKLLSQDKFLKIAAIFLIKIELDFPEEKRKMRKIKKFFPFYPGNDPETNYFLWLRKHTSICLMETYLVFKKWKYWFENRCYGLLEEFYRFGSNILVEYVKKQDRYDCDNMMDHIHNDDPLYWTNIRGLEYSREIEDFYLYYNKEKAEAPAWGRLWAFCLLQLMKDFSATTIRILDNKEKFKFCKKKEETYIEDTEDTDEDIEEEYPLTYASLTKEEKEYIDASVELIRSTLNLGKDEFIDTEEEQCYNDYNISYQKETGLLDAIQTGIGKINGFTVALGVMDFQFMGGSMGSVVGEKISRLIQYATEHFLPLILVCASGGARMQEGSYSLMQMNKIAAVLHTHQKEKNLLYISVLTSPTTGGVTASFGMLGDVTIVEPNAYIAFAGKRVIEQTLNQIVDDEDQISDYLFDFGMFDSMVPRALLKNVLSQIIDLYMYGNYI
uniref:Acetyl-coenzyme A carboxylase carboxyl transferase subunit beta, chloroplastic n=1 Tax=Fitzroya cupressoides TaxID=103972 RepID=A0A8F8SV83_9CONI|nr:acetyl-CoA carboxylase carboxyltransferase beta subunit [Fitzroya cupressoides]